MIRTTPLESLHFCRLPAGERLPETKFGNRFWEIGFERLVLRKWFWEIGDRFCKICFQKVISEIGFLNLKLIKFSPSKTFVLSWWDSPALALVAFVSPFASICESVQNRNLAIDFYSREFLSISHCFSQPLSHFQNRFFWKNFTREFLSDFISL